MARITVASSGGKWRVVRDGVTKSTHRKKRPAVREARRIGRRGDRLIIQGTQGQILENTQLRG